MIYGAHRLHNTPIDDIRYLSSTHLWRDQGLRCSVSPPPLLPFPFPPFHFLHHHLHLLLSLLLPCLSIFIYVNIDVSVADNEIHTEQEELARGTGLHSFKEGEASFFYHGRVGEGHRLAFIQGGRGFIFY